MGMAMCGAGGKTIPGAAALAVEAVNRDKNLLHRFTLTLTSMNNSTLHDSGCTSQGGLRAWGEVIGGVCGGQGPHAVIGPGCSSACEVTKTGWSASPLGVSLTQLF